MNYMLRFESHEGDTLQANISEFVPCTFTDLVECTSRNNGSRGLKLVAKSSEHSLNNVACNNPAELKTTVNFPHQVSVFALVDNGWLPPPFVTPSNFLVDRNVISTLEKISNGSTRLDVVATNWWLGFFESKNILFNPILYALEGSERKTPSFSEFVSSFDNATIEIKKTLPKISVVSYNYEHYKAAYRLITDLSDRTKKEIAFLVCIAPLIASRVSSCDLSVLQNQILLQAKNCGLTTTFSVLAALSCLYESNEAFSVGRKLLKPCTNYTEKDAYNALSDLRAIEIVAVSRAAISEKFFLCTCDKALALLWCGLSPTNAEYMGSNSFTMTVNLNEKLFPRLPRESVVELREKLFPS